MWLDLVTYLHHHGHDDKLPWYRGKVWHWNCFQVVYEYACFSFWGFIKALWRCAYTWSLYQEWSYLRGGLTTLDRDYGWINNIHHDIGTHVVHHLFPQIPHYNLVEAVSIFLKKQKCLKVTIYWYSNMFVICCVPQTEATKPVFGKYYREPKKSGPFPFHLLGVLARSMKKDHYVSDSGDVVYYQSDPQLYGPKWSCDDQWFIGLRNEAHNQSYIVFCLIHSLQFSSTV